MPYHEGMTALSLFTGLLAVLGAARITRVIVTDDIGLWYIRGPLVSWVIKHEPDHFGWRSRLWSGLDCPFCVGFWVGVLVLVSLAAVGGPDADTTAATIWRWVMAAFALNYVTAHVGARLGDVSDDGYDD